MKTKLLRIVAPAIIALAGTIVLSCTQSSNNNATPKTTPCTTSGTTVNIGASAGGSYSVEVGEVVIQNSNFSEEVLLNNTNLNLSITGGENGSTGKIMSAGAQSCLDFTYTGTPAAPEVALGVGAGYVGQFPDGHIVKFIVNSYHDGVANISYIFQ